MSYQPQGVTSMHCEEHGEQAFVNLCIVCNEFVCEKCAEEIGISNYCKKCITDKLKNRKKPTTEE